mgnify:CR=1 FL=1
MKVPGLPFLVPKPRLCGVFGIKRHTLNQRIKDGVYSKLEWVKDGPTLKAVRPSIEDQLEAMKV